VSLLRPISLNLPAPKRRLTGMMNIIPGMVAGAADLDPAAVLTATVAGAQFGLGVAWVVIACIPVLRTVFSISGRIGLETRKGLIELVREQFGPTLAILLALGIAGVNLAMIVGDLSAVSEACHLLFQQPRMFFIALFCFIVWYVLVLGGYTRVTRVLGLLSLALLGYVAAAALATDSFWELAKGVVSIPLRLDPAYMMAVIAVFGSLLTPDILVWQTSTKRELAEAAHLPHDKEAHAGTLVAAVVCLSVIIAASKMHLADPSSLTVSQAAQSLNPLGSIGPVVFAIGILGSALVALPLLVASLCYSVAEAFVFRSGLNKPPWEARYFYIGISGVLLLGAVLNYGHVDTVRLLYWSQVAAGTLLIPILLFLYLLGNRPLLMGRVNTPQENMWLGASILLMAVANVAFLWTQL
jgi:Mn2+/Fe2+ NRAMP family transporter